MSDLRTEWTPEQVQAHAGEANEAMPEARTTDRFPATGRASGVDVRAGEAGYEQAAASDAPDGALRVPADPPLGVTNEGGA